MNEIRNDILEIGLGDLEDMVSNCPVDGHERLAKEQADEVLEALAGSIDLEISSTAKSTADRLSVEIKSDDEKLMFGLIPSTKAVTIVSSSTGLANNAVEAVVSNINDRLFNGRIKPHLKVGPVHVTGFGTFRLKDDKIVFKPSAFEYLGRSSDD